MNLGRQRGLPEQHLLGVGVLERAQNGLDCQQLAKTARTLETRSPNRPHAASGNRHEQLVPPQHLARSELFLIVIRGGRDRHVVPPCPAPVCSHSLVLTVTSLAPGRGDVNCRALRRRELAYSSTISETRTLSRIGNCSFHPRGRF